MDHRRRRGRPTTVLGVQAAAFADVVRQVEGKTIADAAAANARIIEGAADSLSSITLAAPVTTVYSLTESASGAARPPRWTWRDRLRLSAQGNLRILGGAGTFLVGVPGAGAGTLTAGGADNTAGTLTLFHSGSNPATIQAALADNGAGALTLVKEGGGTFHLAGAGANTFTGKTTVNQGVLTLLRTGGTALGNELIFDNNLSPDVYTFADNQFAPGTVVSFVTDAGDHGRLELMGTTQTLAGIQTVGYATQRGVIQNREAGPVNYGNSTLVLNGAGSYSFGGYLRNATGTLALVKNGAGTQTLSGGQITHTGATRVNTGVLELLNTTGYASATSVAGGAVVSLSNTANVGIGSGATFTLENGSTLVHNGQTQGAAYTTLAGSVTVAGAATINQNSVTNTSGTNKNLFLDGGLHGSGTLTINAANPGNAVEFRNNNSSFSGTIIVNGIASTTVNAGSGISVGGATVALQKTDITLNGTMELLAQGLGWAGTASGAFSMGALGGTGVMVGNHGSAGGVTTVTLGATNSSGAFSGVIANGTNNTVHLVKAGAGVQTLSGVNTYTGVTTVSGGTLRLDFGAGGVSNILAAGSALTLAGGTLEIKGGAGESNAQTFNGTGGRGTLLLTPDGAAGVTATLGAVAVTGMLNFSGSDATPAGLGTANFLTTTTTAGNDGSTRLGAHLWNGADWASTSSAGGNHVVQWTGAYADLYNGTGPGPVAFPSGAPASEIRIREATSGHTNNTLGAGETVNSLLMSAAGTDATVDMGANTLTVGNGAGALGAVAIAAGSRSLTLGTSANQGVLTAGTSAAASTLALNNLNPASALTVNSVVANNAAAGVVSLAARGNVVLNGVNTFTGATTIDAGELQLGGAGQLGGGTYAGAITIGGGATLNVNSSAGQTLNGLLGGAGALVKNGAGTLTLGNVNNTFTGGVTVNQGALLLGSTNNGVSTIRGVVTVNAGGTLDWNVANALGYNSGSITRLDINGGTVGGADLTMHYYYDYGSIPINMTGGTLILGGPAAAGSANQFRNAPINVLASGTTARILGATANATMAIRDSTTQVFNVGDGAQAVDLLVDVVVFQNNGSSGIL
ncbi:MAG: autotransporter-associated beta strand repeat-containing protein, partial [Kiritimatiellia bacterium]